MLVCEELYCMYSGRGTCVYFGVADRQEGPAVSVGFWGDLWSTFHKMLLRLQNEGKGDV